MTQKAYEYYSNLITNRDDNCKQKDDSCNKNNYCKNNNIRLLRIPYYKKNDIEAIIKDFLNLP